MKAKGALEKTANRVLNDKTGWGYWIDYCLGYDIGRRLACANMDFTDKFI